MGIHPANTFWIAVMKKVGTPVAISETHMSQPASTAEDTTKQFMNGQGMGVTSCSGCKTINSKTKLCSRFPPPPQFLFPPLSSLSAQLKIKQKQFMNGKA